MVMNGKFLYFAAGEFTVWVTTGKEAAMATRNQVLLVAYGDKDVSREVELGEGLESFRAGHTHEVKVNFSCDLGELYKVITTMIYYMVRKYSCF